MMWIRKGAARTPLVCVHPGDGSARSYRRLVAQLEPDQPVLAFEWPGPHDGAVPTAAAMAERYLAELRRAQPHGPYRLFGRGGGSGIATEMAHRLVTAGDKVTFMLLDPGLDAHTRAEGWNELALIRRLEHLLHQVARGGPAAGPPPVRQEILRPARAPGRRRR